MSIIECGTYAGYQKHWRSNETPCGPCRKAAADYSAQRRLRNPVQRAKDRWWNSTRRAALERLAAENMKRFLELVEEERAARPHPWAGVS